MNIFPHMRPSGLPALTIFAAKIIFAIDFIFIQKKKLQENFIVIL